MLSKDNDVLLTSILSQYPLFINVLPESTVFAGMNPADFTLIVVPLTFLVVILVILVLFYARKKDYADEQIKNLEEQLRLGWIDKKAFKGKLKSLKKLQTLDEELQKLKKLYKNGKLDNETYSRLRQILIGLRMHEQGYTHISTDSSVKKMNSKNNNRAGC